MLLSLFLNVKRKTNFQLYQEGLPLSRIIMGLVWMTGWRKANSNMINNYELKLQWDQALKFSTWEKIKKYTKYVAFLGLQHSHSCAIIRSKDQNCVYTATSCNFLSCFSMLRWVGDNTQQHFPVCSRKRAGIKLLPSANFPSFPSALHCISFLYSSFQTIFLWTSNSEEWPQYLFWSYSLLPSQLFSLKQTRPKLLAL